MTWKEPGHHMATGTKSREETPKEGGGYMRTRDQSRNATKPPALPSPLIIDKAEERNDPHPPQDTDRRQDSAG
jgi:hypothetical protein